MATQTEVWTHVPSGDSFVVDTNDGDVVAACGPVYYGDIPAFVNGYDSDEELVAYFSTTTDEYVHTPIQEWIATHSDE